MEVNNKTKFKRAEQFLIFQLSNYDTERLVVTMSTACKGEKYRGYCSYPTKPGKSMRGWRFDFAKGIFRVTSNVNTRAHYPYTETMSIGTKQIDKKRFEWITEEVQFDNPEEVIVFVLGHEVHHFLCKSKQLKGTGQRNTQCQANKKGIEWLRKFNDKDEVAI